LAFFKKLKDRLFKSSSKIDEGLEAIVSDGGEEETAAVEEVVQETVDPVDLEAEIAAEADRAREAAAEVARLEAQRQQEVRDQEAHAQAAREEAARLAAEQAEHAARARAEQEEHEKILQEARERAAKAVRDAEVLAIQEAADEAARQALEAAAREEETARLEEEDRALEVARLAEQARLAQEELQAEQAEEAEAARHAAVERQAEEEREIHAQMHREALAKEAAEKAAREALAAAPAPEPLRTTLTPVAPDLEETTAPAAKPGLLGRLMGRAAPKTVVRRVLDDDMLEQLEELLISADMGVDTALRVTANMAEGRFGKKLSVAEIKQLMADEIARIMEPVAQPLPLYSKTPQVVLVVGVNGSGKTTTIGKLASQFRAAGKKVVIAAGDTFRAAAVEQLQVWGERAGVPVLTAAQGSDPASLAFDAMGQAQEDGADLLLIDTAGRLQNRGDLMEELAKIVRVIRKKDPSAPHNTLLVLDATTGQNALNQVKVFQDISDVSGLVMTKLDGTAKGGVLVALADKFGLPIHAIGVGEQIDDLSPFDPQEFADALVGFER
jgi:fused signal recognition particle receptor